MAGYAGSRDGFKRSHAVLAGVSFMLGTIVSLMALGAVLGLLGRWGDAHSVRAARLVGGFLVISFGLVSLNLVPFRFPALRFPSLRRSEGLIGAVVLGLLTGAFSMVTTGACCSSLLPVAFGFAYLKTRLFFGSSLLIAFAAGYSLPVFTVLFGIGLGRLSRVARRLGKPIQQLSGALMVLTGFWLLVSL